MKKTKQITIDERTYTVTQYMATRGQKLFIKLGKLFGKPLALCFSQPNAESLLDLNVSTIVEGLFQNIDPESGVELFQEILAGTMLQEGGEIRPINFDLDFAGRYLHLGKLLKEILAFQYSDFLEGLAFLGRGKAS